MVATFYVGKVAVALTLALGLQQPARAPLPEVVSAKMIGHSSLTIKPCQPTNVIIEVEVDRPIDFVLWRRVARAMSEVVIVNGEEFRNRMPERSTLNNAAGFIIVDPAPPSRAGMVPGEQRRARFLVEFFLKAKPAEYLFAEPRRYDIELLAGNQVIPVEVDVEAPTPPERQIIEAINDENVRFFLMVPTNRKLATTEVLALIEDLARQDTSYKKWLSLSLGLGLYHARNLDPRDEAFEEKRRALNEEVYSWLGPYCAADITSRLEAMATYWCGMHVWRLSKMTEHKTKAAACLTQQVELWGKVADSPYGFNEGVKAREALAQIEAAARAKTETGSSP